METRWFKLWSFSNALISTPHLANYQQWLVLHINLMQLWDSMASKCLRYYIIWTSNTTILLLRNHEDTEGWWLQVQDCCVVYTEALASATIIGVSSGGEGGRGEWGRVTAPSPNFPGSPLKRNTHNQMLIQCSYTHVHVPKAVWRHQEFQYNYIHYSHSCRAES